MQFRPNIPDDVLKSIERGDKDFEELAAKMLKAAAVPLKNALSEKISPHRRTGDLESSVRIGKPRKQTKYDAYMIDVTFNGKDRKGSSNTVKAKAIQYGWHHQDADPFLQKAYDACAEKVSEILQTVYEQESSLTK